MSTTPKSAFPYNELNQQTGFVDQQHQGMSLRDYFVAKAMQAAIAGLVSRNSLSNICEVEVANFSQKMATAMLKARKQT